MKLLIDDLQRRFANFLNDVDGNTPSAFPCDDNILSLLKLFLCHFQLSHYLFPLSPFAGSRDGEREIVCS